VHIQQKTFFKILQEISLFPEKSSGWLRDKRLSNIEKKIIESFLLVRDNQNQAAIHLIENLPKSEMPFVESQRNLISGIAYNNLTRFEEAERTISLALPVLMELESHHFLFTSYFNLCHIFVNTKQLSKMKNILALMSCLPFESELQKIRLLRCQFNYFSEIGNIDEANELLKEIEQYKSRMCESDRISQLVSEFMFKVKVEKFDDCRTCLEQMKKNRKFHLSENYNYMKKMLDHLTLDAPVYVYSEDFVSTPVLDYQIRVIHAFEEKNYQLAEMFWGRLKAGANELYSDNFEYNGGICLFSLCLKKHLHYMRLNQANYEDDAASYFRRLAEIFKTSSGPITKGFLYELLWGHPPIDKDDLKKLGRLISRLRSEKGMDIASRKGTYFYNNSGKKKKVA
jgi:hypothetical protein